MKDQANPTLSYNLDFILSKVKFTFVDQPVAKYFHSQGRQTRGCLGCMCTQAFSPSPKFYRYQHNFFCPILKLYYIYVLLSRNWRQCVQFIIDGSEPRPLHFSRQPKFAIDFFEKGLENCDFYVVKKGLSRLGIEIF